MEQAEGRAEKIKRVGETLLAHIGTLVPVSMLTGFLLLAGSVSVFGYVPEWERALIYAFGFVSTALGLYACLRIATEGSRGYWSVFIFTLVYREAALLPVFFVLLNSVVDIFYTPQWFSLGLLVVSGLGIGISNLVLFLSLRYDVLAREIDPVPLRDIFRRSPRRPPPSAKP